jgi:voltage-gated potassium channel
MTDVQRAKWERAAEWPLTIIALLFLGGFAWPILEPNLDPPWPEICRAVTWAAWAAFVVDYLVRLSLAMERGRFIRSNLLDLAVVVLPVLRPLRLLRLVTMLSVLNRYASGSMRGRVAVYVAGSTALVLFVASLSVLDAERGHRGSNIKSFDDALWWAATTVTTVGYGDHFPVTGTGRLVAGGLMLAGIALLGIVTASFASWLIERVSQVEEVAQAATRRDVEALTAEIAALRSEIAEQ